MLRKPEIDFLHISQKEPQKDFKMTSKRPPRDLKRTSKRL